MPTKAHSSLKLYPTVPLLKLAWVKALMRRKVDAAPPGPDAGTRAATGVEVWGEAITADGRRASATISGPNGYDITVEAALSVTRRLLTGPAVEGGYYTPSLLMGPDFAASLPGIVQRPVVLD